MRTLKEGDRCKVCGSYEKDDPRHGPVENCHGPGKPCQAPQDHHKYEPEDTCPECGQRLPK